MRRPAAHKLLLAAAAFAALLATIAPPARAGITPQVMKSDQAFLEAHNPAPAPPPSVAPAPAEVRETAPERPARISATLEKLRNETAMPITWGKPAPVHDSVLLRAHTAEHLARLNQPGDFDADTPYFPGISDYGQ